MHVSCTAKRVSPLGDRARQDDPIELQGNAAVSGTVIQLASKHHTGSREFTGSEGMNAGGGACRLAG